MSNSTRLFTCVKGISSYFLEVLLRQNQKMKLMMCVIFVLSLPTRFLQEIKSEGGQSVNSTDRKGLQRVIGGEEATKHAYPYMVFLRIILNKTEAACGGSLISTSWVLTAAHCMIAQGNVATYIEAWLGIHDLKANESTRVVAIASRIIPHELYEETYVSNDIGLLQLSSPVILNEYIGIVPYGKQRRKDYVKSIGTAIGWGFTWEWQKGETKPSNVLKHVNSTIMTLQECALFFKGVVTIGIDKICLSGAGPVGVCSGDSGGPLLVHGIQVGITSFASGMHDTMCLLGGPSIFTKIPYHRDWIEYYVRNRNDNYVNFQYSLIKLVAVCLLCLVC